MHLLFRSTQRFMILAFFVLGFQACSKNENNPVIPTPRERGEIAQSNSLGTLTANQIQQVLAAASTQTPFTLAYSVETVSITYLTLDGKGNKATASGALFIPQGIDNLPLLSIQHGTQTRADLVASVSPLNSTEGIVGLIAASMGYVVVVPDYLGFGVSTMTHPYLHAESLVPSIIDFIRAGRSYSSTNHITLNGQVFLTGYSEGGYASLVTQEAIEKDYSAEFSLKAVAPASGPYDLQGMVQTVFQTRAYSTPAYIAFFLSAYNELYGWNRLDDLFNEPYASSVSSLFNGSKTWGEVVNQLPATFSALVDSNFVSNYLSGNEQSVAAAMQENTRLNWLPQTPIHFFHGDADDIVPYQHALAAVNAFTLNGATNIQLTTIPGGTHETSGLPAIIGVLQWFEGYRSS